MKKFTDLWLIEDCITRCKIIGNREAGKEEKAFAALELFCLPVSLLAVFFLLPLRICSAKCGWGLPAWYGLYALPVLLSAAVGYVTNYIAIEMLFKPYEKTWKHPFAILTFGYWQQGLVPKNKDRIAVQMGAETAAHSNRGKMTEIWRLEIPKDLIIDGK